MNIPLKTSVSIQPAFATIQNWCLISGMTRSSTYLALNAGALRAIKQPGETHEVGNRRRTLIDVEHGLAWLRAQPLAKFGADRAEGDAA